MRRCIHLLVAVCITACLPRPVGPAGMVEVGAHPLPTALELDRLFVLTVTEAGDTLALSVESGNVTSMLYAATVERLDLPLLEFVSGADTAWLVAMPALEAASEIPPLAEMPDVGSFFFVFPADVPGEDGFLGQSWLAGRAWRLDYPEARISLIPPGVLSSYPAALQVPLGFRTDGRGGRLLNVPRVRVKVGSDSLDLVLDTGASVAFSDTALEHMEPGGDFRGASLIALSVLRSWKRENPSWVVVENADANTGMPMIHVPNVEFGGTHSGPVWFVATPDDRFFQGVSGLTDLPVYGALGGNAFRGLAVMLDYERAIAVFERVGSRTTVP